MIFSLATGLLLNLLNVCADVHPMVPRIILSGIALAFALEAVAALVLGVVKTEGEISDFQNAWLYVAYK